jgi:hypothetical protein
MSVEHELRVRVLRMIKAHAPFRRMMLRTGIDPTGNWWRGFEDMMILALRRCEACPNSQYCQASLDQEHPQSLYPIFCPNSTFIEACRIINPSAKS